MQLGTLLPRLPNRNVKKKSISNILLSDMLGEDGAATLKDFKKKREMTLAKELHKVDIIHLAVCYFEERMKKRRAILLDNIDKFKSKMNEYEIKKI